MLDFAFNKEVNDSYIRPSSAGINAVGAVPRSLLHILENST